NYCSADVYSLKLKKEYEGKLTLEYIAAMLNSKLMEFISSAMQKKSVRTFMIIIQIQFSG
ncbi:MAG: hypothetical protein PHC45_09555, partial [Clostridiaceae bacterium]|nr:hypothetical protein [Clostridiaceae bacterium]